MTGTLKSLGSRAIIGAFFKRLEEVSMASWVPKLASVYTANQETETYTFVSDAPSLQERGAKATKRAGLKPFELSLKNKTYQNILEIDDDDFRRDKTDQILARVRERAARAAQLPQKLMTQLLNANGNAYDGVAFFHASNHRNLNGDQVVNLITRDITTPAAPTVQEAIDAVLAAIVQIQGFKDDEGEPRNEFAESFLVMCPQNMFTALLAATRNDYPASGTSNTLKNSDFTIEVRSNPRLTSTTTFDVFRADSDVKALLWQDEVPTKFSDRNPDNSDKGFEDEVHLFKTKRVCAGGYGRFDQACRVSFT